MDGAKLSAELWPIHLKPKDDELLSSWLVRLARGHRLKVHTFCSIAWPGKQIWNRDIDNSADAELLGGLSVSTGTLIERVRATTLAGYENVVYEKHNILGPTSWVLPIGVYHRTHKQFGLQYCPLCLAEDKHPYYRRKWRLAFMTSCERHHILLQDCCPQCRAAINFHRGEMGIHHKSVVEALTLCHACGFDLRTTGSRFTASVTCPEVGFTAKLLLAMDTGSVQLNESVTTYAQLYFAGLRQMLKIAAMRDTRIDKLRRAVSQQFGVALYSPTIFRSHRDVQEMGIEERRQLIGIVRCLLEEWPNWFIELSRKHNVWSSIWLRHLDPPVRAYSSPAPFWFWSVVHDHLYRAKYCPSDEEIKAAIMYLKRTGKVVNKSTLAKMLGVRVLRREFNHIVGE